MDIDWFERMRNLALLMRLAILFSSGVAATDLTDVKLGAYSTTMSLEAAQKIQGGEIKCHDETRMELTVRECVRARRRQGRRIRFLCQIGRWYHPRSWTGGSGSIGMPWSQASRKSVRSIRR